MSNNNRLKYTAEYVRENSVEIVVQSDEEFSKIKAIMGKPTWSHTNYPIALTYNYGGIYANFCWHSCSGHLSCSITITAEQFIKDNETMPEKWMIKLTEHNWEFLEKYLHTNSHKYSQYEKTWTCSEAWKHNNYFYCEEVTIAKGHSTQDILPGYAEITFEEFLTITNQHSPCECPKELTALLQELQLV